MSFSAEVFGQDLSQILNVLIVIQNEESKQFNREGGVPLIGIFTNPTGTSWFEADMLTRHFYSGEMALKDTLAHDLVPGARGAFEWTETGGMGVTMLRVRQMLLSRYMEMAASLQFVDGEPTLPGPAVRATVHLSQAPVASQPPNTSQHLPLLPTDTPEWEIGHWTLRPTGPEFSHSNEMRPIWSGPVLMAIPNVFPVTHARKTRTPNGTERPQKVSRRFPPPTPIPEFHERPSSFPASGFPVSSFPVSSFPASSFPAQESPERAASSAGSSNSVPESPSCEPQDAAMPPPAPVRGPTWLTRFGTASIQSSPPSPSFSEYGKHFEPPGLPEPHMGPNPEWYPGAQHSV